MATCYADSIKNKQSAASSETTSHRFKQVLPCSFNYRCVYVFIAEPQYKSTITLKTVPQAIGHVTSLNFRLIEITNALSEFKRKTKSHELTKEQYYRQKHNRLTKHAESLLTIHDFLCQRTLEILTTFPPSDLRICHDILSKSAQRNHEAHEAQFDLISQTYNLIHTCSHQSIIMANFAISLELCLTRVIEYCHDNNNILGNMQEACFRAFTLSEAALRYYKLYPAGIPSTGDQVAEELTQLEIHQQAAGLLFESAIILGDYIEKEKRASKEQTHCPEPVERDEPDDSLHQLSLILEQYLARLQPLISSQWDYADPSPNMLLRWAATGILSDNFMALEKAILALTVKNEESYNPEYKELLPRLDMISLSTGKSVGVIIDLWLIKKLPEILKKVAEGEKQAEEQRWEEKIKSSLKCKQIGEHFLEWWNKRNPELYDDTSPDAKQLYEKYIQLLEYQLESNELTLDQRLIDTNSDRLKKLDSLCSELKTKLTCTNWDIEVSLRRVPDIIIPATQSEKQKKRKPNQKSPSAKTDSKSVDDIVAHQPAFQLKDILTLIRDDPTKNKDEAIKSLELLLQAKKQPVITKAWAALYLGNISVIPCTKALHSCFIAQKVIYKYEAALTCNPEELPPKGLSIKFLESVDQFNKAVFEVGIALQQSANYYRELTELIKSHKEVRQDSSIMAETIATLTSKDDEIDTVIKFKGKIEEIYQTRRERLKKFQYKPSPHPETKKKRQEAIDDSSKNLKLLEDAYKELKVLKSKIPSQT